MTYPTIWFLRHGQTEWNREYRLQGQLDSPLTEQGAAEARRQADLMPPILAQRPAIFVSPLGRTRQTADIALRGAAYRTDPRLMEINAGAWQGLLRDEILATQPDLAARAPTPLDIYEVAPGGEGLAAFQDRIRDFMRSLDRPTVVVAHGLLGQVLRAEACGLPPEAAGGLSNLQGCVYVLKDGIETCLEAPE
ncbi:Phosphoserine phosphatase 1 [Sulfitobacter sp. THAF37]|uniref:histidine phosphatase family protein n=1 Tax=Sulfitobacter sp. THAF37 TaxID=2587855 RepID=UPI001267B698|nr:histidine phosphatase family protein [Sulfitobacter sp. THAF37]QFT60171.1 Phosphoserine phosphatase 1 [Sulfitobacter sp. THAF37]